MPTLNVMDHLRLEVEDDPAGLRNWIKAPDGDLGGWGWVTPVAGTIMDVFGTAPTLMLRLFNPSGGALATQSETEDIACAAGQWVGARLNFLARSTSNEAIRLRIEFLNAAGAVIGSGAQSALTTSGVVFAPTTQAPVGTASTRLRVDAYTSGGNLGSGRYAAWREAMLAIGATSGAVTAFAYVPPFTYVNVLGPTADIKITRDELAVGLLTATILDATLDPSQATLLRPGRKVRVMALDPVSTLWTPLFVGTSRNAKVTYDYKTPGKPASKRARISLTASDDLAQLAGTTRAEGVATIAALPYVLEGAGVPWNVNGSGNQVPTATVVVKNPNATALAQVAVTRDSVRGYAWMSRAGILNARDSASISATVAATFDEDDYTDLSIDYDTERCINAVNIKYLRINLATGETVEVPYGPYLDAASVRANGIISADFTIQGITESDANMAAYAAAVLAANANPVVRINTVTLYVGTPADVSYSLRDLYDLVTLANANAGISEDMRITGVEHTITADSRRGGRWFTTYSFAADGGVAPPLPSSPAPTPAAATDWTTVGAAGAPAFQNGWVNFGGVYQVARFRKRGDEVIVEGLVKSGAVGAVFTLPAGYRPLAQRFFPGASNGAAAALLEVLADGRVHATVGSNAAYSIECRFTVS